MFQRWSLSQWLRRVKRRAKKTRTRKNWRRPLLAVSTTEGMSNSSALIAKSGTLAAFAMTKSRTIILFAETLRTCFVCYAAIPNPQRMTVESVECRLLNITVRFASSGTMTERRAFIIAMTVVFVGSAWDLARTFSTARYGDSSSNGVSVILTLSRHALYAYLSRSRTLTAVLNDLRSATVPSVANTCSLHRRPWL